jgi:proline iminopeptidase/L-proline amide hydrolase
MFKTLHLLSLYTLCIAFLVGLSLSAFAKSPGFEPEKEVMVPVEGGKVYVRVDGEKQTHRAPVIFIHGGPGGTHNGFIGMTDLADERMVIMYDQLDSGKSEQPNNPKNWRVARFVESLETIRKHLGVEQWHLVGQSWGAALALEYSAKYPQHTMSTVLGGTFISTPHWIMDANLLVKAAPQEVQETLRQCESSQPPQAAQCYAAYTKLYSPYYTPNKISNEIAAYQDSVGGNGFNPLIYNAMWGPSEFSSTGVLKHYDATHLLAELDPLKTLFMIGQYDSARIDTVQNYVALTPGAELAVVPGGAHGFYDDRPLVTLALLRSWLRRKDAQ